MSSLILRGLTKDPLVTYGLGGSSSGIIIPPQRLTQNITDTITINDSNNEAFSVISVITKRLSPLIERIPITSLLTKNVITPGVNIGSRTITDTIPITSPPFDEELQRIVHHRRMLTRNFLFRIFPLADTLTAEGIIATYILHGTIPYNTILSRSTTHIHRFVNTVTLSGVIQYIQKIIRNNATPQRILYNALLLHNSTKIIKTITDNISLTTIADTLSKTHRNIVTETIPYISTFLRVLNYLRVPRLGGGARGNRIRLRSEILSKRLDITKRFQLTTIPIFIQFQHAAKRSIKREFLVDYLFGPFNIIGIRDNLTFIGEKFGNLTSVVIPISSIFSSKVIAIRNFSSFISLSDSFHLFAHVGDSRVLFSHIVGGVPDVLSTTIHNSLKLISTLSISTVTQQIQNIVRTVVTSDLRDVAIIAIFTHKVERGIDAIFSVVPASFVTSLSFTLISIRNVIFYLPISSRFFKFITSSIMTTTPIIIIDQLQESLRKIRYIADTDIFGNISTIPSSIVTTLSFLKSFNISIYTNIIVKEIRQVLAVPRYTSINIAIRQRVFGFKTGKVRNFDFIDKIKRK